MPKRILDEVHVTLEPGVILIPPPSSGHARSPIDSAAHRHEHRLERLVERMPPRLQTPTRWLRRPSSRWVRIPAGTLLIGGGVLSVLPFLGIWMLPVGLALLAEDVPALWRARGRVLDWIARRRPHWFAEHGPTAQPF